MCSRLNGYPERLWTKNRPINPIFHPEEYLYRRFHSKSIFNGQLLPTAFRFPNCSVNRSLYSEPFDVLLHDHPKYAGWGVAKFTVEQASISVLSNTGTISFQIVHKPVEYNYSHSEILHSASGEIPVDLSNSLGKKFREKLVQKIVVCREATPDSN